MNKVISREYVEKNYIKKQDLLDFIENALNMCNKQNEKLAKLMSKETLEGITATYKALHAYIEAK